MIGITVEPVSVCPSSSIGKVLDISELAGIGSESLVRATSGAGCLLLTGMVSAWGSGRIDGQVRSVSGAGLVRLYG